MSLLHNVIQSNSDTLKEGIDALAVIDDVQYVQSFAPTFQSCIADHYRHIIEHYQCLFSQIPSGAICYDKRVRCQVIASSPNKAKNALQESIKQLERLPANNNLSLTVQDVQTQEQSVMSNLSRELLFLQSHTVHHFAIIGAMLRMLGLNAAKDFGVAIATREHQVTLQETVCAR